MLTLGTVLTAHLLPLFWYLAEDNSSALITQPPVLTGVFVQQPASQAVAAQSSPPPKHKREAENKSEVKPEPARAQAKPAAVKQPNAISAKPDKPATKPVQPATAAARQPEPVSLADTATVADTVVDTVADNAATKHSAAAAAVPVSAPLVNASAHYNAPPLYPQLSRKLREQGTVVLQLTVLASGKVADVTLAQSSGYARLDKAALLAVQHWRYQPAQRAGKAIDYRYRQRVEFSLTEGVK
ncbi:energy transducer TonB [Rheinheimera sp. YQF-2]|uniref:Energy transducer TonB n=1 Tax=Rheinheimera lutimaris TaxID=2740584 RepID=A0A7Y5EII3_9GAMM|nr:energy transducer TonB [Rheinheimera lutimaris]NRQ43560.1 energy transducer TonB [Rheinheimera lutimaris]